MAVPLSPSPGAEVNVVEFKEYKCSWVGENKLQLEDRRSSSVRPEAAVGSLDTKVQKCGGVKFKDDVESLLGEKPQPKEQELSAELPLTEQLRVSTLLIREQKWELSELTKKLKEGRAVSLLLKESLEVHLSRGHPDTEHSWQQGLAAGCRLAEQLVHMLKPEIPEQEEDGKEQLLLGPSVSAEGLQREEEEDHLTPSGGSEPGETQQPPCTTAALVDEVETPSPGASENQNHPEDEDTLEPESPRVIIEDLALDLKPIEQFQRWRDIIFYLRLSLKDMLTPDGPVSHQEQHAERRRLAKSPRPPAQPRAALQWG